MCIWEDRPDTSIRKIVTEVELSGSRGDKQLMIFDDGKKIYKGEAILQAPPKHDFHKTQSASSLLCYEAGVDRFDWCTRRQHWKADYSNVFRRQILYRGHGCQFKV